MRWHKLISTILHPVVMPTIGILLYTYILPDQFTIKQQYTVIGIIFTATYIIPVLLLVLLKTIGYIKSYRVHSISERKIPLLIMILLFISLAKLFERTTITKDLSYLFYGTALGLVIIYVGFLIKLKTSLHLLSIGSAVGFFWVVHLFYGVPIVVLSSILILLSGLLASSRLYLKAHKPVEVYTGFILGILCQFVMYWCM